MNSSTAITSGIPATERLVFQPDAAEYCDKHNLHPLVELTAQIAARHFTLVAPTEVELETDPDSDEQRPILNLTVAGGVDEVENQYQAFTRDLVSQVPIDSLLSVGTFLNLVGNPDEPA